MNSKRILARYLKLPIWQENRGQVSDNPISGYEPVSFLISFCFLLNFQYEDVPYFSSTMPGWNGSRLIPISHIYMLGPMPPLITRFS